MVLWAKLNHEKSGEWPPLQIKRPSPFFLRQAHRFCSVLGLRERSQIDLSPMRSLHAPTRCTRLDAVIANVVRNDSSDETALQWPDAIPVSSEAPSAETRRGDCTRWLPAPVAERTTSAAVNTRREAIRCVERAQWGERTIQSEPAAVRCESAPRPLRLWGFEQRSEWHINPKHLANPRYRLCRQKRMPPQSEEIVVYPDCLMIKHLRPHLHKNLLM